MKKLVIDRSKWRRGEGVDGSRLIREEDGKMCCLGFAGLAFGVSRPALLNMVSPSNTVENGRCSKFRSTKNWPEWLLDRRHGCDGNTGVCGELMITNDNVVMYSCEREDKIKRLFAQNGIEVEFIDGPESP